MSSRQIFHDSLPAKTASIAQMGSVRLVIKRLLTPGSIRLLLLLKKKLNAYLLLLMPSSLPVVVAQPTQDLQIKPKQGARLRWCG